MGNLVYFLNVLFTILIRVQKCQLVPEMLDLASNLARLALWKILWTCDDQLSVHVGSAMQNTPIYILYTDIILNIFQITRFVPFGANLAQFEGKSGSPGW